MSCTHSEGCADGQVLFGFDVDGDGAGVTQAFSSNPKGLHRYLLDSGYSKK